MTSRSWLPWWRSPWGAGAFGCSHEQKAPPAHPAPRGRGRAPHDAARAAARGGRRHRRAQAQGNARAVHLLRLRFGPPAARGARRAAEAGRLAAKPRHGALRIEGNCDELGTTEYNLALGEERARAAQAYLLHLGVPKGRLQTVSYGSERPKYPGHDDDAHAKNRRDDLIVR